MELETASPTFGTLQQEDDFFFLPQAVQSQDSPKVHQIRNDEYIDTESVFKNNLFKTNFSVSTHGSIEPALKAMDFNTVPSHHYKNEGIRPLNYHSATNRTSKHQHTDSDPSNADTDNTFGSLSPSSTRSSGAKNVDTASRPYTSYAGKLKVKYEQVEEEEEDEDEFHAYSDNEEPTVPSLRPQASNQSMRDNPQIQPSSRCLRINEAEESHQNQNHHLRPSPSLPLRSGSLEPHGGGGGREREDASSLVGIRSQSSMRAPSFDGSERDHDNTVRFAGSLGNKSNGRRHEEPNDYSRLRQTIRDVHAREEEDANYREQDDDDDKFYRRATHRSKLLEFIPTALAEPVHQKSGSYGVAHLPDWNTIRPGELTSQPISNVKKDMDWSLRRLISRTVFEQLLSNNLGRHRFREYLVRAEGTETQLDLLFDMIQFQKMVAVVKDSAEALHDVYLASDSVHHQRLPVEIDEGVFKSVKTAFDLKLGGMADAQNHLLSNFYANEFQRFIKNQLIEQTKVAFNSDAFDPNDNEMKGLGDCYCLTNPRLRENPIVLVSDGFTAITGYKREQIIGRNCRFLQGPSTSPASIQRIRDALNAGEPLTELILNYKLNGDPFWNLLNLIPLRSRDGSLAYFIGSQTNVTGTLAGGKLSFLTAGMNEEKNEEVKNLVNGREVSSTMARHLGAGHAAGTGVEAVSSNHGHGSIASRSSTQNRRGGAAGAYDPSKDSQHGYNSNINVGMLAPPPGMEGGSISKKSGFMKMFGGKGGSSNQALQRVPGAEATIPMRNKVGNLEDQMDLFSQQTSKLIIFRRQKREVLFATPELVKYFGLPIATSRQILASPLIHADLLSLVRGNDKEDTKFLRSKVSAAISKGEGLSIRIGIRKPSKKWSLGKKDQQDLIITWTTLVLTPLMDRDNSSFAMIALFG